MMKAADHYLFLIGNLLNADTRSKPTQRFIGIQKTLFHDEAEEEIWANVIDIGNHLIGLVSGPTCCRSHKHKTLNREYRAWIETRLLLLERQMTFSFMNDCISSLKP